MERSVITARVFGFTSRGRLSGCILGCNGYAGRDVMFSWRLLSLFCLVRFFCVSCFSEVLFCIFSSEPSYAVTKPELKFHMLERTFIRVRQVNILLKMKTDCLKMVETLVVSIRGTHADVIIIRKSLVYVTW